MAGINYTSKDPVGDMETIVAFLKDRKTIHPRASVGVWPSEDRGHTNYLLTFIGRRAKWNANLFASNIFGMGIAQAGSHESRQKPHRENMLHPGQWYVVMTKQNVEELYYQLLDRHGMSAYLADKAPAPAPHYATRAPDHSTTAATPHPYRAHRGPGRAAPTYAAPFTAAATTIIPILTGPDMRLFNPHTGEALVRFHPETGEQLSEHAPECGGIYDGHTGVPLVKFDPNTGEALPDSTWAAYGGSTASDGRDGPA